MTVELKPNFRNSRNANNLSNTVYKPREQDKQASFKGLQPGQAINKLYTKSVKACDQNMLVYILGIDVFAMILPRIGVDMTRNKYAALETGRREITSAIVDLILPGMVALGIAKLAGVIPANKNKVKTNTWANSEQIKLINNAFNKANKDKNGNKAWIEEILKNTKGVNGTEYKKAVSDKAKNEIAESLYKAIKAEKSSHAKEHINSAMEAFLNETNAQKNLKVNRSVYTNLKDLFNNIVSTGKSLTSHSDSARNEGAEFLQKLSKRKSLIALGTAISTGVSLQFWNRWLTKKKTGCDGFVGYSDYSADTAKNRQKKKKFNPGLIAAKAASIAGFAMLPLTLISGHKNPLKVLSKKGLSDFAKKLEFTNRYPSMNQIRAVYSTIIMGRVMASSDGNELRETMVRDTASYFSWLCLGGLAAKAWAAGSAGSIAKNPLFNFTKKCPEKGFLKKLGHLASSKTVLKSHDELGKASKHIGKLNTAIVVGIANSCFMLGLGIPYLNKIQTNLKSKKWKLQLSKDKKPKEQVNQFKETKKLLNTNKNNEIYSSFLGDVKNKNITEP